MKITSIKEL